MHPRHGLGQTIGAAIAVTGLKIALQTGAGNPYDMGPRPILLLGPTAAMDDKRDGSVPPVEPAPAAGAGQMRVDATLDLVEQVKAGDQEALNLLCARFLPPLRRWASGRLPQWSRDLMDTDDLVQETVVRAINRIDQFESRHEGALQAYLRQAIVNRIRDELRRAKRSPVTTELPEDASDHTPSPLEAAIGAEALTRYEAALQRLRPEEREAIVARVEMEGSYQDVARALGKPSADAARMAVSRALLRLAEEMSRDQV